MTMEDKSVERTDRLQLYDLRNCIKEDEHLSSAQISDNGQYLAVAFEDGSLHCVSIVDGRSLQRIKLANDIQSYKWCISNESDPSYEKSRCQISFITNSHTLMYHEVLLESRILTTKLIMSHKLNQQPIKHLNDMKICESWFDENDMQWNSVFWSQYGIFTLKYEQQTHILIDIVELLVVENEKDKLLVGCSASLPILMAANSAGTTYIIDVPSEKLLQQNHIPVGQVLSSEDINELTQYQSFRSFTTNSNLSKAIATDDNNNIYTCDMLPLLEDCQLEIKDNRLIVVTTTQSKYHRPYINQNDELIVNVPDGATKLGDAAWLSDLNYLKNSFICDVEKIPQCSFVNSNIYWEYIPVPHWMNSMNITILLVEMSSVLFHLSPSSDPTLSVFDELKYGGVGLLEFDSQTLSLDRFDDYGVLVESHCKSLSHCIIDGRKLYLETFGIPQQDIICHIIQFGGVSKAEALCKYNRWDQFLIPLHILSIGLQHKQLDTVAFFLKSREKAFTRRLKVLLSRPHHSASSSSLSPALSPLYTNSPDIPRRQRSTSSTPVDANELLAAIDLLLGTLQNSYKKKHKEYFFQSLLSMTHTYVNSLLRDAVEAQKLLSNVDPSTRMMLEDLFINSELSESSLLGDMNDSIMFLSNKVLELRKYFKIPQIQRNDFNEVVNISQLYGIDDFKRTDNMKDEIARMLLNGNIATLQSKLLETFSIDANIICNGSWESLKTFAIKYVFDLLNKSDFDNSVKILNNMGLDTVDVLKSIYKKTINKSLRDFMFDHLKNRFSCFSVDEMKDYEYCCDFISCYNDRPQLLQDKTPWNMDVLSVFENEHIDVAPVDPNVKCVIYIKLIERWDTATRQKVLLDFGVEYILSRGIPIPQDVLWSYLTSHNNMTLLKEWIRGGNYLLPKLDGNAITKEKTICMKSSQKIIEKELSNCGIFLFSPDEDFPELLTSICRSFCLFTKPHPMLRQIHLSEKEREERKLVFDREFVKYCISERLDQFLYSYLDYYELQLDGTPKCNEIIEIKSQPSWVKMMSAFREAAQDASLVYKASISNAEHVYAMPDASLNSIIKAGKPIVALATALLHGDGKLEFQPSDSHIAIDRDLLQSSLHDYPKLKSALCASSHNGTDTRDPGVSVFDLLHDNTVLDLSGILGHMPANTYFSRGEYFEGMPSFSNPELSKKFGIEIQLSWQYFVQLGMGSFAYFYLMKNDPDISKARKRSLYSKARLIAIANFDDLTITASCILFLGCLGCNTLSLQVDVEVARFVNNFISKKRNLALQHSKDFKETLKSYMTTDKDESYQEFSKLVEEALDFSIDFLEIDRESFKALNQWKIYTEFCKCHKIKPNINCLVYYAKRSLWLHFIYMMQLHQFEPEEGIKALETGMTNLVLKEHLIATLRNVKSSTHSTGKEERQMPRRRSRRTKSKPTVAKERNVRAQFYSKLGTIDVKKPPASLRSPEPTDKSDIVKNEDVESVLESRRKQRRPSIQIVSHRDIFSDNILDILLKCERLPHPWRNLLSYSIVMKESIFAVLAGCYKDSCYIYCICVWLCVVCGGSLFDVIYMDICGVPASTDTDFAALQRHDWSKEDLSVIFMLLLNHDFVSLNYLQQGFFIFLPECPLTILLQFWVNFATMKAFDECKKDLIKLNHALSQDYTKFEHLPDDIDSVWTISMIVKVIKKVLIGCELRYYQWQLLNLLFESPTKTFWEDHDIEIGLLEKLFSIVLKTDTFPNMKHLISNNETTRTEEHNRIIDSLVEEKEFTKAKQIARLLQLSIEGIAIKEVEEELYNFQKSLLWDQYSSRIAFWESFNQMLIDSGCPGVQFGKYLQELSTKLETISFEEKSILLTMALQWQQKLHMKTDEERHLSQRFMSNLEQEIWMCKIRMEEENMKGNGFETKQAIKQIFSRQRSVSISGYGRARHSEFLQPEVLHGDALPSMSPALSTQEEVDAFESLIGKLLDECEITQARRVAHQFKRSTKDLDIVLSCIFLAEGTFSIDNLSESVKSILAKTPTRHLFSPAAKLEQSGSFSRSNVASLSSISTSPGGAIVDWVLVEEIQDAIEKLMSRCKLGKNCCHRVLVSFNISQLLNLPYSDVVVEPAPSILASVLNTELEQRFVVCKQYVKAYELSSDEAGSFVCEYISSWYKTFFLRKRPDPSNYEQFLFSSPPNNDDIQLLFQLVQDTTHLGHLFIKETNDLFKSSDEDDVLSTGIELLICAHSCFTLSCNMEGISEILQIAKRCVESLKHRKLFSVMVRLLVGIGRYKEMNYIFEILRQCLHFELLFKQSFKKDNQLKRALLDFMHRHHPNDVDNFKLITLHFNMFSDAAKQLEETGQEQIKTIKPRLKAPTTSELEMGLKSIADTFSYAADYYKQEQRHRKAGRCVRFGQLALLQKRLLPNGTIVLGLDKSEVKSLLGKHMVFAESLLVADAYDLMPGFSWADALYNIYIKGDELQYFNDFTSFLPVTTSLAAEISSRYKSERHSSLEAMNMKKLLSKVKELRLRHKLAHDLGFNELATETANEPYLKDTMFLGM